MMSALELSGRSGDPTGSLPSMGHRPVCKDGEISSDYNYWLGKSSKTQTATDSNSTLNPLFNTVHIDTRWLFVKLLSQETVV